MADFRKLFLALSVLAVLALPVIAQPPPNVTCVSSSAPVLIRDGGLTELVGDVMLECTNNSTINVQSDIQVQMISAPITNKVLDSTGSNNECQQPNPIKCVTDAVIAAKWPTLGAPPAAPGVVPGMNPTYITGLLQKNPINDQPNLRYSVLFPGVPIPAGTTTSLRISNIRIAPNGITPNGSQPVNALVTTTNVVVTPNNVLAVAYVLPPLDFQTTSCDGTAASIPTFKQCIGQNSDTTRMTTTFNVQFIELLALAFKPRIPTLTGPAIVGSIYLSESGYILGTLTSPGGSLVTHVGEATTGTNLLLRFSNIPTGVSIYVTKQNVLTGTSEVGGTPVITASNSADAGSNLMSCSGADTNQPAIKVTLSGGAGQVAWVVDSIDSSYQHQKIISFGVAISYVPDTAIDSPGLTGTPPGQVNGSIAPLSAKDYATPIASLTTTGDTALPRFRDTKKGSDIFVIVPCVTNILFPYVTIKAGFDTGIALVNTSKDDPVLETKTQHGYCTMYYFDGKTDGTTPHPQKTCDIPGGGMTTFSMMTQGGIPNQTCPPPESNEITTNQPVPIGWQGYAIASCRFQFGRGYAFISDRNIPGLGSQGYLPLILPACTNGRSPNALDGQPRRGIFGIRWDDCGEGLIH